MPFAPQTGATDQNVVDMAVSEQDRGGLEPVLGQEFVDTALGVLTRIDDHALGTGRGRDYITVGRKRAGREPCDEHNRPFSRYGVSGYRGNPHGREPITKGTGPGIWKVRFANDREYCGGSGPPGSGVSPVGRVPPPGLRCLCFAIRGMHRVRRPASREYLR